MGDKPAEALPEPAMDSDIVENNFSRFWVAIAVITITIALYLVSTEFVYSRNYAESDFISFWNSATIVANGGDPYDPIEWEQRIFASGATIKYDDTFLYPITLAVIFSPLLGHLPLGEAFVLWDWLSSLFVMASALIVLVIYAKKGEDVKHYLLPLLAGIIIFRPVLHMMWSGQLVGWLMIVYAITIYLWEGEKWWQGGAVLALLALKPGIGVPVIALLVIYLIKRRKYGALAGIAASGLILLVMGFAYDPDWMQKFLSIGSAKSSLYMGRAATIWGTAGLVCGNTTPCTQILGAISSALIVCLTIFSILKQENRSPLVAASGIIGASVLVTPYLWAYDQTLLIFPIIVSTLAIKDRVPYLLSALLFIGVDVLALISLALATHIEHDGWTALPSIAVFILWIAVARATRTTSASSGSLVRFRDLPQIQNMLRP